MLLVLYFSILHFKGGVYPWYLPPAVVLGLFVLASLINQLKEKYPSRQYLIPLYAFSIIYISLSASVFFMTVKQISAHQEIIEYGNRMKIGLWLRENVKQNESVFLEALGYIGYFSNAKMLDWPGLVAPEIVAAADKKEYGDYEKILRKVKPTWQVLRLHNYNSLLKSTWFKENYIKMHVFDVRKQIHQLENLPGVNYLYIDSMFIVVKKINKSA